jgi:putative membrane protein
MMYWYGHDMGGGWGYAAMAVGAVLFLALLAVGLVMLVRFASGDQASRYPSQPESLSAQQVLGMRFARGEIDEKEYREKLAILRDHSAV